jgi:hypothetical protein
MAQLPTRNAYINAFLASERRHRTNWVQSHHVKALIFSDHSLLLDTSHLTLKYDSHGHLNSLIYHFPFPAMGMSVIFQHGLWYDHTFNQLPASYQIVVRRVMQYWTPHHWRGF